MEADRATIQNLACVLAATYRTAGRSSLARPAPYRTIPARQRPARGFPKLYGNGSPSRLPFGIVARQVASSQSAGIVGQREKMGILHPQRLKFAEDVAGNAKGFAFVTMTSADNSDFH